MKSSTSSDGREVSMWWTFWGSAEHARKILLNIITNQILCLRYYRLLTTEQKEGKNNCVPIHLNSTQTCAGEEGFTPNAVQSCTLCARTNSGVAEARVSQTKPNQTKMPLPLKISHRNIHLFFLLCFEKHNYFYFSDFFWV